MCVCGRKFYQSVRYCNPCGVTWIKIDFGGIEHQSINQSIDDDKFSLSGEF